MIPGLPNPWLILGFVAALGMATAGAYFKGRADMDARYKAAALKAANKVIEAAAKQGEITTAVAEKAEEKQAEIRIVTRTIVKEVKRYVPVEVDRACSIPVGVVGLHDAAAAGRAAVPEPAGEPDGAASAVGLAGLTETVIANYGTCHEDQTRLRGLQDWIRQQQALWGRP